MVTIARVSTPTSGLVFQSDKVRLKIGEKIIDTGSLYITVNSLAWQPENVSNDGISIGWREVSVQGISSEPTKCIYFMLDQKLCWRGVYENPEIQANGVNGDVAAEAMDQQPGEEDEDEGNVTDEEYDDDNPEMTECWLLPDDQTTVDLIFQAMNECQALHPDDSISEESDFMDNDDDDDYDDEFDADAHGRMLNLNLN